MRRGGSSKVDPGPIPRLAGCNRHLLFMETLQLHLSTGPPSFAIADQ